MPEGALVAEGAAAPLAFRDAAATEGGSVAEVAAGAVEGREQLHTFASARPTIANESERVNRTRETYWSEGEAIEGLGVGGKLPPLPK